MNESAVFFALAVPAVFLPPILIVQDLVGILAFPRNRDGYVLGWTLPGAAIYVLMMLMGVKSIRDAVA